MKKHFIGFGFGAIQAGLFLYEAQRSGNFDRLTVAEVVPDTVQAVRAANGRYRLNVAREHGIEIHEIPKVAILNPTDENDRQALVRAVCEADEIATALPSVKFYGNGESGSVTEILASGLKLKLDRHPQSRCIIYAAENHNRAAEILEKQILKQPGLSPDKFKAGIQCLNTVIGKMSGVVTDERQLAEQGLARMAGNSGRCFLVEVFNRILISRISLPGFKRGITVFEEKDDLLPFEEAKLYGHNATHALLGYLADRKGYTYMADVAQDKPLMDLAHEAFIAESGQALCRRHAGVDPLFTPAGYRAYAEDLLKRMINPFLKDTVERVVRDPRRKLGWDDRLVGTMRIVLKEGITPARFALGAGAALQMLTEKESKPQDQLLDEIWADSRPAENEKRRIKELIFASKTNDPY